MIYISTTYKRNIFFKNKQKLSKWYTKFIVYSVAVFLLYNNKTKNAICIKRIIFYKESVELKRRKGKKSYDYFYVINI